MSLERVLTSVRSFADLPAVVAALGHEPLWDELDPAVWAAGLRMVRVPSRAAVAGRAGEVSWYALEAAEAERTAVAAARRLARHAQPAAVLAVDLERRRLAFAVAWGSCPSLSLDLDAPGRVGLAALARVASLRARGALAVVHGLAEALSAEGLGRRFFIQFRTTLERFAGALRGPADPVARHTLALVQLSRVLFLYFVQAKGWLDGDEHFLARQVNRCLLHGRSLHRQLFEPLFFGTLDRPIADRGRSARTFGRIPFLNGGLFEPHPLERRWRIQVPNAAWRDAFDDLFEHFVFTADERHGAGAVAPDMLGQVFEGVMAADQRRASGTFYTPAALVRRIVDDALRALVAARLGTSEENAERLMLQSEPRALAVLARATVLDPAVGSGAFLLGALERIAAYREGTAPPAALRRDILRRSLFGVDLDAGAVRLAELRLWLAVVAEEHVADPMHVQPLPNLDCLIRQGDSLADPAGAGLAGAADPARAREIGRLRAAAVAAYGRDKQVQLRELRRLELAAVADTLTLRESAAERAVHAALEAARAPTLFGTPAPADAASRRQLRGLRRTLHEARRDRRRFERTAELPWFSYHGQFAEVFARGGFDVVLGNPPWVRAEALPRSTAVRLAARYRWWHGPRPRGFGHRPDLSLAFLERACELAAPAGVVAMLVPAKLATADYGAAARDALARGVTLRAVADLASDPHARFDATTYPLAIVAVRDAPAPSHRVRAGLGLDAPRGPLQSGLAGGGPWILAADPLREALAALRDRFPTLGTTMRAHLGAKTGANEVFLDPPLDIEPELIRWAVRGRDIGAFRARAPRRFLWTHDAAGRPLPTLPPRAAAWISRHAARLRARSDYKGGPEWAVFRAGPAAARHRVVWADLARQLTAVALIHGDDARLIPLNTCYVTPMPDACSALALAAWLNCAWCRTAARAGAVPAANGFARFAGRTVESLPLPGGVLAHDGLITLARRAARGHDVQRELDGLTADLLELSPAVRRALLPTRAEPWPVA